MPLDPATLLDDLNPAQREAVTATSGPVAILAGAGTGKTRVVTRRAAYAIATGTVPADQVLVVTFTDKAAGEMADRLRTLGFRGVTARTFHAHALSQLRHFWPSRHDGAAMPDTLESKLPLLIPIARDLPVPYRFTPVRDLATEIEWAKSRRLDPAAYAHHAEAHLPPIPADLMTRVYGDYERAKSRAGRVDFDDMLGLTVALLESDAEAAATVRARKRWFSVDEYQDTNPLQQRLLELWAGEARDVCVVGDVDQSIYGFTGATPRFLTEFADRHANTRVIELTENYRSTPEVLSLANRLLAAEGRSKRLDATRPSGPAPVFARHASADSELAAVARRITELTAAGTAPAEIAILVRVNAQVEPVEAALTRAGIPYQVRGLRFYDRPDVRAAIDALRRADLAAVGAELETAIRGLWATALGVDLAAAADGRDSTSDGDETRERAAALGTLADILGAMIRAADGGADVGAADFLAELARRASAEREGSADGVNLLTYHRAKGLEWDAVFLPMLEEGSLPIRQSVDDPGALEEERRLLYVGLTRARVHLTLSWAERRESRGRDARRRPSRFIDEIRPIPARHVRQLPDAFEAPAPTHDPSADPLFAALRAWRSDVARAEAVPAYVVAHDQTLAAIADARPSTMPALRRVRGMGPAKLDKYGDDILRIVAAGR
ncbi:MAG TPA: ATP-dependent DNA helicase UvrD2 [Candidatus Limnocylindrales bacterium]|nr:ATP-dependent DNA helicase UvrD2 [Candidatus Limnocylindrales bacterium]